ncbi:MAG: hypothetical protein LBG89_03735 [Rickettsiales bacterium]|jgi:hypothetical protein|nr:hypothetical protein [Rickettsiales bacterium]
MLKIMKLFGAACGFAAVVSVAGAAGNDAGQMYGTPPASTGNSQVVDIPTAGGAQQITLKVRVRGNRRPAAPAEFAQPAPRQDVIVDGHDEEIYNGEAVAAAPAPQRKVVAEERQNLAHPFFQPAEGKFAISLNADYARTSNEFTILQNYQPITPFGVQNLNGHTFDWTGSQLIYKAGASYGITDSVEVKGAVSFHNSTWTYGGRGVDPSTGLLNGTDIVMEDSGFESWGLGIGWRAYEDEDFIFKLSGEFRSWEKSNLIYVGGMGGVKRGNSTIYASVGGFFYNNEGNAYGFGLADMNGAMEYVLYEEDNKNPMFIEGTLGLFSVLSPDFSLDVNITAADLSWHNTLSMGGTLAFQPTKSFAVMAYGQYALWDSASGMDDLRLWSNIQQGAPGLTAFQPVSDVRLERPTQFAVGVGAKIYF